jgi:hypothetical protein
MWRVDSSAVDVKVDQDKALYARLLFPSPDLDALLARVAERVKTLKVSLAARCCCVSH